MPRSRGRPIPTIEAAQNRNAAARLIRWAVRFYNSDALFVVLTPKERAKWDNDLAAILNSLNVKFDGRRASSEYHQEMVRRPSDKANLIPDDEVEFVDLKDL